MPRRGRLLTAAEIREFAHHVGNADDYDWYFNAAFPLQLLRRTPDGTGPLDGSPAGWVRWLEQEKSREALEEGYGRGPDPWGQDFEFWWVNGGSHPEENPIVATEQADGFGVHDGNHRVAVSHRNRMKAVPVYVGYRR